MTSTNLIRRKVSFCFKPQQSDRRPWGNKLYEYLIIKLMTFLGCEEGENGPGQSRDVSLLLREKEWLYLSMYCFLESLSVTNGYAIVLISHSLIFLPPQKVVSFQSTKTHWGAGCYVSKCRLTATCRIRRNSQLISRWDEWIVCAIDFFFQFIP